MYLFFLLHLMHRPFESQSWFGVAPLSSLDLPWYHRSVCDVHCLLQYSAYTLHLTFEFTLIFNWHLDSHERVKSHGLVLPSACREMFIVIVCNDSREESGTAQLESGTEVNRDRELNEDHILGDIRRSVSNWNTQARRKDTGRLGKIQQDVRYDGWCLRRPLYRRSSVVWSTTGVSDEIRVRRISQVAHRDSQVRTDCLTLSTAMLS